jgi:cold shock CspA family protein
VRCVSNLRSHFGSLSLFIMPTATGLFKKWMGNGEYGLINPDDEGEDVHVHKSLLQNETVMRDTRVVYEAAWDLPRRMWICTSIVVDKRPPPPPPLGPPPGWIPRTPRATDGEPAHKHPRRQ